MSEDNASKEPTGGQPATMGGTRDALHELIAEIASTHEALSVERLRGVAFFDTQKDALFTSLPLFGPAVKAAAMLPNFAERVGSGEAERTLLQFIYEYFRRVAEVVVNEAAFEALWNDLIAEMDEPFWVYRGVANLRHFSADYLTTPRIDLGDGVSLRGRSRTDLLAMGFDDWIRERLVEDWHTPFGASSYVLVTEYQVPKSSDNLILMESGALMTKALRAVQALRLSAEGAIGIGPMWAIRAARFDFGTGGLHQSGFSVPTLGANLVWRDDIPEAYTTTYDNLAQLETTGYAKAPGNLDVALRSFQSTYDRWPTRQDSQLLDAITALEALFGIDTELSFRLAFRVAGLLAGNDQERNALLKLMRGFYDTRSTIVHGGSLKAKHQKDLSNVEVLRALVRRLLRSFVAFAVRPPKQYPKSFFKENLDAVLVDSTEREKLRTALGLLSAGGFPELSSLRGTSSVSALEP